VLSDESVLVMGGFDLGRKNDVWKTVNGGASWILVTSSAGWEGKNILHLSSSLPLLSSPSGVKILVYAAPPLQCVSCVLWRFEEESALS
jgi:hypothetical protein